MIAEPATTTYTAATIGKGKVVHAILNNTPVCGVSGNNIHEIDGQDITCKRCTTRLEKQATVDEPIAAVTTHLEQPIRRTRKPAPERTRKSVVVHNGRNRHQKRAEASTARTQASRDTRNELKLEMNRVRRNRRNLSFKINRGGQFRRYGAA